MRNAGAVLAIALGAAAVATGSHLYFRAWEHQGGLPGGGGELLDYAKLLKTRADDEKVLSPAMYRGLDNYLDAGEASRDWPERAIKAFRKQPLGVVRELSCEQPPPFTWIARDAPEHRAAFDFLARHYEVVVDPAGLPIHRPLSELGAFLDRFPIRTGKDHPGEVAAYLFAQVLLHDVLGVSPGDAGLPEMVAETRDWARTGLRLERE